MSPAMQLALAVLCATAALGLLAYGLDLGPAGRKDVQMRVAVPAGAGGQAQHAPARLGSTTAGLGWRHLWVTSSNVQSLERGLLAAGKPASMLRSLVLLKLIAPVWWVLAGGYLASSMGNPLVWLVYLVGIPVSYMYPDIYVRSRAAERNAEMVRALPDLLDQMTIALDAGMSFEAAFARVGASHQGPLGPQFMRTVQDMAVGVPRREAYLALAARNDIEDLTRLVKSLVQAEEFGVPVSQVVRLQAVEMRDKRRQRAAATAKTIPLKLLGPTMACLLPTLFIVMLTPAVMSLGSVF